MLRITCSGEDLDRFGFARDVAATSWPWFWEGQASTTKAYRSGKIVEMSIVESPHEVVAFIAEVGVAVYLYHDGHKIYRRTIQSISDRSNAQAVNRYTQNVGVIPGFSFKPGRNPVSPNVPSRHDILTNKQKEEILQVRRVSFSLPKVRSADYLASVSGQPELANLESIVRSSMQGFYYGADCGRGQARIPFFSEADPIVYVYANLGACGRGIISFARDENGRWMPGNFSPDRPPNQWSPTIKRIRENTIVTLPLLPRAK